MKTQKLYVKALRLIFILGVSLSAFAQDIPDPESYFGFKPGADYKLIRWDKIVSYFDIDRFDESRESTGLSKDIKIFQR